jgi:hypothetical protein
MSEPSTETVAPAAVSRQDAIAAAAAAADIDTPEETPALTTEDVAGEKPAGDAKGDRELVAPSIREFIRAQQAPAKPEGLELEIQELRGALNTLADQGAAKEAPTETQSILAKLEALENREATRLQADSEARAEEEYNNRVRTMREGVIENISAEEFPGLVALEQQEVVFNALVERLQADEDTSEVEVASEVEDGLRTVYQTLHAVYGSAAPSKDQPVSEPKQTLTPALASTEEAPDLEKMSVQDRKEYLWDKYNKDQ